jgi:hypothetical protein
MQSRRTPTTTAGARAAADNTFTATAIIKLKGAKDLKKYTTAASEAIEDITRQFQADLTSPSAIVDAAAIQDKNLRFKAEMCAIEQRTFVHNITRCHPSPVVSAKDDADKCLANLENLRKMLVNNKQQKKTTIKQVRGIIQRMCSAAAATIALLQIVQVVPDASYPVTNELKGLIVQVKQNHKTVAKNLREQVIFNMRQMRNCILAYQCAAETTIQQIFNHGEKTRAMVRKYQDIELIEYCARVWWSQTQQDPMDHRTYTVLAREAPRDDDECPEISASFRPSLHRHYYDKSHGLHSPLQHVDILSVVITVRDDDRTLEHPNGNVVDTFYLADKRLAKQILNENAIRSFEAERTGENVVEYLRSDENAAEVASSWRQQLLDAGVREEDMVEE